LPISSSASFSRSLTFAISLSAQLISEGYLPSCQ
jgi:hypothetical protein